ncbi:NAD(P)-binding protein [Lophium mytilinum]|uniref:NAD(P)-binding protein n=1 Tax=Lophium mytilinum TaxID=390894 RepID=A0A6A6QVB4_9PEZI|nr:NAD(P)-binding protein [Lophium mytilinum]
MFLIVGRHALITGGSRGIGLSIARLFAAHSCRITVISRNQDIGRGALDTLPKSPDGIHRSIAGDISSSEIWAEPNMLDEKVDILVNAAGVTLIRLLVRSSIEDVQKVVQTNLTGSMLAVRYLLKKKLLRAEPRTQGNFSPVVINLASLLAVQGGRGSVAYSASKAGVLGLTRALAAELGPTGIRVNAIVPGYIETDMTAGMDPEVRRQMLQRIPLGRFGQADEIADAALFLATNQYANNCVINLDGGLSAT